MSRPSLQTDEENALEEAQAILANKAHKDNELFKAFSSLTKSYKKLHKQHRFLMKRSDKQELEMRRINEELIQTNKLLKSAVTEGTMQVREDLLTEVMNLTSELVLTRNQLIEGFRDALHLDGKTSGFLQNLDMVTSSLQERIMQTRMQPVGNVFATLPNIITTESQRLRKFIRLETEGADVELDKRILDSLPTPLASLVRNACDHGIEPPSERYESGKPEIGVICVSAFYESGQVNILIQDDGRGIDESSVKQKALKEGVKTRAALEGMSEKDIPSLITMPGFSPTMDRVMSGLEQQGGSVDISSMKDRGVTIRLKLPLTLSIIPCLMVRIGAEKYAIPKAGVDELVCLYDDEIFTRIEYAGLEEICRLRNMLVPMVRMKEVLAKPEKFMEETRSEIVETYSRLAKTGLMETSGIRRQSLLFAVVKNDNKRFGIVVDQVLGSEEIVVSPMHPKLKSLGIYSGATIMGDGTIALVLDIQGIASHTGVEVIAADEKESEKNISSDGTDTQRVLVFKSGVKERFAVPLLLIRRVEEISPDRMERVGDKEYIPINGVPTLLLRMDRLLDVSPCDEREEVYLLLPRHKSRPFGILISRLIDVFPAPLTLNEKSHTEDGILGSGIIQDRMTLFPDVYRLLEKADPDARIMGNERPEESVCRILLVEDSLFFRGLVKGYLESENYSIVTAEHGENALEILEEATVDLIVSDIEMPEMDGWAFIQAIRANERHRHVPAIALTALDSSEHREKAEKLGFDAYEKKIDRERLLARVSELLKLDA